MATNQINSDSHLTLSNLKKNKENYLVFFTSVPKFTKEPTWSKTALNTSLSNETPGCCFLKSSPS